METKSRYEVASDLEAQKRNLIKQRSELDFGAIALQKNILTLKRAKEDLSKIQVDFNFEQEKKLADIERAKKEYAVRMINTNFDYDRKIEDAVQELTDFNASISARKATITEQLDAINESLERMNKLQEKK